MTTPTHFRGPRHLTTLASWLGRGGEGRAEAYVRVDSRISHDEPIPGSPGSLSGQALRLRCRMSPWTKIRTLRTRTAAPLLDCERALVECGWDVERAVDWLRRRAA